MAFAFPFVLGGMDGQQRAGVIRSIRQLSKVTATRVATNDRSHAQTDGGLPSAAYYPRTRETTMAKGQTRSNREVRKPKKEAGAKSVSVASTVTTTFAKGGKGGGKPAKK